jgi:hypothetical protein
LHPSFKVVAGTGNGLTSAWQMTSAGATTLLRWREVSTSMIAGVILTSIKQIAYNL